MLHAKNKCKFNHSRMSEEQKADYYVRDVWFRDIQVMTAREQQSSCEGFYIAAKVGIMQKVTITMTLEVL